MIDITCNEHVNYEWHHDTTYPSGVVMSTYRFYPDEGYALWRDNEKGNLDEETGEPIFYWYQILTSTPEEYAPHIWAKPIDETMEVFGVTNPNQPDHTYTDENGVERDKHGIF